MTCWQLSLEQNLDPCLLTVNCFRQKHSQQLFTALEFLLFKF